MHVTVDLPWWGTIALGKCVRVCVCVGGCMCMCVCV